ncbi:F-box domain-containing protein [Mycena sanguinolenta]|uniref:F-box domain-containing protein n=1 Tax=Mycena sanguinolenta TaxID=230812 RepID=A0A8H6ZAX5_9AGAR|nr:F-box domain-containing protein [Mycena sanguinolenta]
MPLCRTCGFDSATDLEEMQPNTILGRIDLRNRLSELDALITSLTTERERLRRVADRIVYPVLSLPPEITAEIFLRCIPPQSNLSESPSEAPLLLAQICRQWRQIALDTPHLWQSLLFRDGEASIELLRLWLSRSGSLPLTLDLKCWDPPRVGTLMELSLLHSHRWRDVKFGLPHTSFSELDLRQVSLPLLDSISLRAVQWSSEDDSVVHTVTITHAPSLRHAHLFDLPSLKMVIPWAPLTTLTLLHNLPFTECISLLQGCPNLINLTVSTAGPVAVNADHIILNSLETLTCNFGTASILEHLTLPRLSRLDVSNVRDPQHAAMLSAFIGRSGCPLQFLAVRDIRDISPVVLVHFLRAVPDSVSDVEFAWARGGSGEPIFSALQLTGIIPQLKVLQLHVSGRMDNEEYKHLLKMLSARVEGRPPRVPLESMTLHVITKQRLLGIMPRSSRIAELRQLATVGMKVKFTITSYDSTPHVVLDLSAQGASFRYFSNQSSD